ncbi:MAG: (2Fe-2S) ferredoxin domain-containing protein, partial [Clostridia bacterium]|nr:(2Fe-2S) ferredoxin domain-containing protein [Clostridia bacterium]
MKRILLCTGTGCVSSGSRKVTAKLKEELEKRGVLNDFRIVNTGCHGFCEQGPIMIVEPEGVFYCRVAEE